jgi:hypothetical protein
MSCSLFSVQEAACELQFQFERRIANVPVLTIDQCQGRKRTLLQLVWSRSQRFRFKNRLNVSRVRRKLYFVADMNKFEEASRIQVVFRWPGSTQARGYRNTNVCNGEPFNATAAPQSSIASAEVQHGGVHNSPWRLPSSCSRLWRGCHKLSSQQHSIPDNSITTGTHYHAQTGGISAMAR